MSIKNEMELNKLRGNEKMQGINKEKMELCPFCSIVCNFDINGGCLNCGGRLDE